MWRDPGVPDLRVVNVSEFSVPFLAPTSVCPDICLPFPFALTLTRNTHFIMVGIEKT